MKRIFGIVLAIGVLASCGVVYDIQKKPTRKNVEWVTTHCGVSAVDYDDLGDKYVFGSDCHD